MKIRPFCVFLQFLSFSFQKQFWAHMCVFLFKSLKTCFLMIFIYLLFSISYMILLLYTSIVYTIDFVYSFRGEGLPPVPPSRGPSQERSDLGGGPPHLYYPLVMSSPVLSSHVISILVYDIGGPPCYVTVYLQSSIKWGLQIIKGAPLYYILLMGGS